MPIKKLFNYSSVALIVLAAGMVAYGTHELEDFIVERKVFPALTEDAVLRPWDILEPTKREPASATFYTYNAEKQRYVHWLHDSGAVGVYLKGFFGYNSNPNYLEVFLWALTLLGGLYAWRRLSQAPPPKPAAS